ncbi:MAG: DNA alkylation repair protein [Dysgonamonadaceae bacterium]|jgi:3-methyladenine DNA glycosylase AlkD|nr:DNA alkylation repair protein [Dysgonamonadaceae bacterium]
MDEIIRQIRTDLRLSMNGVVSTSMREKGMNYRMNFGVTIPKLRQIAQKYRVDKTLAEALWQEDVRELKILATMLYPTVDFSKEAVKKWVYEIPNQEIREQVCRNLFQELTFVDELAQVWAESDEVEIRLTGYCLFVRLCIVHAGVAEKVQSEKIIENAVNDLKAKSMLLLQSALNVLKYFGRLSKEKGENILRKISDYEKSDYSQEREIFDVLRFEYDFWHTGDTNL